MAQDAWACMQGNMHEPSGQSLATQKSRGSRGGDRGRLSSDVFFGSLVTTVDVRRFGSLPLEAERVPLIAIPRRHADAAETR